MSHHPFTCKCKKHTKIVSYLLVKKFLKERKIKSVRGKCIHAGTQLVCPSVSHPQPKKDVRRPKKRESLYPKCLYCCTACTKNHRQKGNKFCEKTQQNSQDSCRKEKENKKQTAYNVIINAYRHSSALHAWVDMQAKEEANRHKRSARKKLLKYETKINSSFHVFMCALHTSVHSFHEFSRTSKIKSFSSSYSLLLLLMLTIYLLMCLSTYFLAALLLVYSVVVVFFPRQRNRVLFI